MTPGDVRPFEIVLKDGYYSVACVKDHMYYFGDKFGGNKFDYKEGKISNTSVVLYSRIVPKKDQKPMSPAVCFSFCRTVPDMLFFGIVNGKKCYCAPFFKAMAAESDTCDVPCEGSPTQTCGSKVKSTVYEMHLCQDTQQELQDAVYTLKNVTTPLEEVVTAARSQAEEVMQKFGAELQEAFGKAGDPGAAALTQKMKVAAGELLKNCVKPGLAAMDKATQLLSNASTSMAATLTNFGEAQKAEETLAALMELAATAAKDLDTARDALLRAAPQALPNSPYNTTANVSRQYVDVLYLTGPFVNAPSTCTGTAVGQPKVATMDGCATACDREVHSCVGFSFMGANPHEQGFCFLFSEIKTMQYYTTCGESSCSNAFRCMLKFSKFQGTKLRPDPSGKCDKCLKKLTKADRCFDVPSSFAGCGPDLPPGTTCEPEVPPRFSEKGMAWTPPVPECADWGRNPGNCAPNGCHSRSPPLCEDWPCGGTAHAELGSGGEDFELRSYD